MKREDKTRPSVKHGAIFCLLQSNDHIFTEDYNAGEICTVYITQQQARKMGHRFPVWAQTTTNPQVDGFFGARCTGVEPRSRFCGDRVRGGSDKNERGGAEVREWGSSAGGGRRWGTRRAGPDDNGRRQTTRMGGGA